MSFGLHDKDWVDPDEEGPHVPCNQCEYWEPCPCGCGKGWCSQCKEFTDEDDGEDC